MRVEQLEQFITLANYKHFRKAAEVCNLSTSALTRSIQTLETDFGCSLLTRSTRSVNLTEAGEVFLQYCYQALDNHALLIQKFAKLKGVQSEKIIVGYSSDALSVVPQACGKFMKQHPNVSIEMKLQDTQALQENVKNGSLDIAVNSSMASGSHGAGVIPEQVVLFCHKNHPILSQTNVDLHSLQQYPLLAAVNTNKSLTKLMNNVAMHLGKFDSMRLGTFEQVSSKLSDHKHIGLSTLDDLQQITNDSKLVDLNKYLNTSEKLNLELQIAETSLSTASIKQLLNFIKDEANHSEEDTHSKATF